ncbi:MAG TPA: murein biosynthesis integral membrane protein MurJ [Ktedonosporobacter sp.]|nr:murein biosynthesis integral membrane protein MurJ [Ktedonosporobacter sp.]
MRGDRSISHEVQKSIRPSTETASVVEGKCDSIAVVVADRAGSRRRKSWGGRTFRFSLQSFLPGKGLFLRRFSVVEAALLLMMALLASRGLGVVRQSIFNALFGTGPEANAYYAALRLPDTLFNLIAGGALVHAFIPVLLSYEKERGELEVWRLTSLVFNVLLVLTAVLLIIGEFLTPAFVNHLLVPGYSPTEQALTASLTRIMLVQPLILGLGTIAMAVLNGKRQFMLPAASIAIYNIGMIAGLLITLAIPKAGIYGPTYGVLIAAILQVGIQIPGLVRQRVRYEFVWDLRHPGLRQVMRLLTPNALAIGIFYIGTIADTAFSSYLPDAAGLSALHNAQMLQAVPLALMSQAIGQALLPHLSVQAASNHYMRMTQTALKVMGVSILLAVPAAIVLAVAGKPVIHLLFQHGAFTQHSTDVTNLALLGYAVGVPGLVAGDLIVRGFYALKDAWTPLWTNIFALLSRVSLIILLLQLLKGPLVILAIPLALAGSASAEAVLLCVLLFYRLRKRITLDKGMQRLQRRRFYQKRQQEKEDFQSIR